MVEPSDDVSLVNSALSLAQLSFSSGRTRPLPFRLSQILSLLNGLHSCRPSLCDALSRDLGRSSFASWFYELQLIEHECEHVLNHLKHWITPKQIDTAFLVGPARSKIVYEPLGVVAVMGSWNFPVLTTLAPLIYVIAAGNTAVIKPSEMSPNASFAIKEMVERYLDKDCYICIEGGIEVAKAIPRG